MSAPTASPPRAGPLRFADPALEGRFLAERQMLGLNRARVMTVISILVVGALGLVDVAISAAPRPEFAALSLRARFLVVAPIWLVLLGATALPAHRARPGVVYTAATVAAGWALALLAWFTPFYFRGNSAATLVTINTLAVLMIAVFSLPMRFGAIVTSVALTVGGIAAWFFATRSLLAVGDFSIVAATLGGVGGLVVLLSWFREGAERRSFARREEVRALNAELARLNAEKNEFMAIAAHDLRAPLASVRGLAEQLAAGRFAAAERAAHAHAAILDLTDRMLALVNDYLGAHAAESGALLVRMERVDLQDAATRAAARHAAAAATKAQRIEVAPGPAGAARTDAALLDQVLDNFVSNALKFSPRGATVRLGVAVAEDVRAARLEVSDDGPGIDPADQPNLFRKFGRTPVRPTGGETSFGLGLAVAKRLAEAMDGRVGCDSATGQGATFWVELKTE